MSHIRALTTSGTSSSSLGRSCKRKSLQWLSLSRFGKNLRIYETPIIPAQTLMLNCCWYHDTFSFIYKLMFPDTCWHGYFFLFLYLELVSEVCPHSTTLALAFTQVSCSAWFDLNLWQRRCLAVRWYYISRDPLMGKLGDWSPYHKVKNGVGRIMDMM